MSASTLVSPSGHRAGPARPPAADWAPIGIAVVALVVAAVVVYGTGIGGWVLVVALGAVFYLVGLYLAATGVEGRRAARNRIWSALIYSAFVLAILPLASVVWTLVSKGVGRLDGDFFGTLDEQHRRPGRRTVAPTTRSSARWSRSASPR